MGVESVYILEEQVRGIIRERVTKEAPGGPDAPRPRALDEVPTGACVTGPLALVPVPSLHPGLAAVVELTATISARASSVAQTVIWAREAKSSFASKLPTRSLTVRSAITRRRAIWRCW